MSELTDEQKERIAIEVEHLPPDEAQAEYERRCEEQDITYERHKIQGL